MQLTSTLPGDVSAIDVTGAVGTEPFRSPVCPPVHRHMVAHRAKLAALALLAVLVGCCVLVEVRVATARKRRIDLDVVLRAAWAVRVGENPYTVTNERGWHYNIPPLLAILLVPLAESPPEQSQTGTVPILAALAIWNAAGLLALVAGVHLLARSMEIESSNRAVEASCWQWWAVRAVPVAASLPTIGVTLNRGQVNLFLAALLCAAVAGVIRGRRLGAGVWLAGAVCLKILPAYLLLYPLWARDRRWLAGAALGLVVGLGVIPAVAFGPSRAVEYYRSLCRSVLLPGLNLGGDQSRTVELIDLHGSDSQSFQVLFDNILHPERPPGPSHASTGLRLAHWLVGGVLTLVTLWAGSRRAATATRTVIRFGALAVLMVAVSPASHAHYFCVNLLLIMGLVAASTGGETRLGGRWLALLLVGYAAACTLPMLPDLRVLRDIRLPLLGSLALWSVGILTLSKRPEEKFSVSAAV